MPADEPVGGHPAGLPPKAINLIVLVKDWQMGGWPGGPFTSH